MTEVKFGNASFTVDDDGFLTNMDDWNEEVAQELAKREEIEHLTEDKMEIVKFMREYYKKFHAFPILNYVCRNIHQPRECVNEEFINPMKAWKVAGLPKPDGIHFVAVDDKRKTYFLEECC